MSGRVYWSGAPTLARDVLEVRPAYHGLQVLFLVMCAEATAKLHAGNAAPGESRRAVLSFFEHLLPEPAKQTLINGFRKQSDDVAELHDIVDALYKVRCAVAHEGDYWSVFFSHDGVPTPVAPPETRKGAREPREEGTAGSTLRHQGRIHVALVVDLRSACSQPTTDIVTTTMTRRIPSRIALFVCWLTFVGLVAFGVGFFVTR